MRRIVCSLLALLLLLVPAAAERPSVLDPLPAEEWDAVKAAHLLERAGFGGTPEEILRLAAMPLEQAIAYLVDYEKLPAPPVAELPEFDPQTPQNQRLIERIAQRFLREQSETRRKNLVLALEEALDPAARKESAPRRPQRRRRDRMFQGMSPAERERAIAQRRATGRARAVHDRQLIQRLRQWWVARMIETRRPLEEKMTLFWHGHFASEYKTVRNSRRMLRQNELFRKHATGSFAELVLAVAQDPAMLRYLDGNRNIKTKPNENFARELMELFTIGIGNYTEQDIKEAARAFTGWTFGRRGDGGFIFRRNQHDFGQKSFMGQRGDLDGADIVRIILGQPQPARFICAKLCRLFVAEEPDPALVDELARTFREGGYQIKPVLRILFASRAFYSPQAMGGLIKSPAQLLAGTARLLGLDRGAVERFSLRMLPQMGQQLFQPPNVKGWDGGRAWINSSTLLVRYNLTRDLLVQDGRAGRRARKVRKPPARDKARPKLALLDRFESFETSESVVNHLTLLLLRKPLPEARMAALVAALAPPGSTFDPKSRETRERIVKLIILITSLPEYQLC